MLVTEAYIERGEGTRMSRSEPRPRAPWTPALLISLAAALLLALSLRTATASVPPIAAFIDRDISVDGARLGLLGMAPAVAFAAAGLFSAAFPRGSQGCVFGAAQ